MPRWDVPGTVGCRSPRFGEGEQLPWAEVLHSQGSGLSQLSWSQTDAPKVDASGYKPTWLPVPKPGRRVSTSKPSPSGPELTIPHVRGLNVRKEQVPMAPLLKKSSI